MAIDEEMPARCYLLELPLEIRQDIYRELFLCPSVARLDPSWLNEDDSDEEGSGSEVDISEFHGCGDMATPESGIGSPVFMVDDEDNGESLRNLALPWSVQRHVAILRTNHQIYAEATSLIYSDMKIVIRPRDLVGCGPTIDMLKASKDIWRHSPFGDSVQEKANEIAISDEAQRGGFMEPDTFLRFRNVCFEAHFGLRTNDVVRDLGIKNDMLLLPEQETKLVRLFKSSKIIINLARLLSRSKIVKEFELKLRVEVDVMYDSDSVFLYNQHKKFNEKNTTANKRATELFLEAGMLDPLYELSNIKSFRWEIQKGVQSTDVTDLQCMQLQPKYTNLLMKLRDDIQRNYAIKYGAL